MRGISRVVLARDAAARLSAAACKELYELWDRQEKLHGDAATQEVAHESAQPLLAICAGCPAVIECRSWAEVDEYTGIAGGAAWVNGVEKPVHWRQASGRSRAS